MYDTYRVNLNDALVARTGTDGYQPKFLYGDKFIKCQCELQRYLRDDWLVEYIASLICEHYNINAVVQRPCNLQIVKNSKIYNRMAVVSYNFELEGLHFISCERLFNNNDNTLNSSEYRKLSTINKIYYLIDNISYYTNLNTDDVMFYIFNMLFIDLLVLNQDRHSHNFGVMWNDNGYTISKLFDFGMGLFEHTNDYDDCYNLDDALYYASIEPFSEEPFILANLLLQDNNFLEFLEMKRRFGKLIIDKTLFPSELAYEYFLVMKDLLGV